MPSFPRTLSAALRRSRRSSWIGRVATTARAAAARSRGALRSAATEDGFLLIEVLISAMLVALIVIATFNGFDVVNRTAADERNHSQAADLAAESQEQLRSDPATALETLEQTPHSYTKTLNGTKYTITESAEYLRGKTGESTCTSPTSSQSGQGESSYLRITSLVAWHAFSNAKSQGELQQSSVITPPTGSALEVEAANGASPEEGVSGVNADVEYTGVESTEATLVEGTTGSLGCLVFGAIPATTATLSVKPPHGYVTPAGAVKVPSEKVTIAPNITTHKEYTFNRGGAIKGEFTWEGKAVEGETFVAYNNGMITAPEYILASPSTTYESGGEERYTPGLGSSAVKSVETPVNPSGYPTGDLFPFTTGYTVYAGDCPANNVSTADQASPSPIVKPGATTIASIPMSYVTLNVYKGTSTSSELETEPLSVQITNTGCASSTPNNATKGIYVHEQKLSGGHLTTPYQPFGSFTLCVYSGAKKANYSVSYANSTAAGSTRNILLGKEETTEQGYVSVSGSTKAC